MDELDFLTSLGDNGISPETYQYFHQLFHNRTIILNDAIDDDIIEKVWLPLRDFENDDSTKPVTLIINSLGGSVTEGFFFAYYLSKYKKPLEIIVPGCAASMAAVILAGCGKNPNITRKCYPSTYCLLHDGYVTIGTSESKTASDLILYNEKVDNKIKDFIVANTNITEEEYVSYARKQWFLTGEELIEKGLIDEIM